MKYQQLTEGLRYQTPASGDHGPSQARIAKQLGFIHRPSVVSFVVIVLGRPISRSRLTNLPRHDG